MAQLMTTFVEQACRRELIRFPQLRRWEQTNDLTQYAVFSLLQALANEKVQPQSEEHLRNVAQLHVRWTAQTLVRSLKRSVRLTHATPLSPQHPIHVEKMAVAHQTPADATLDWIVFHDTVQTLPEVQRDVFRMVWYEDQKKADVAAALGMNLRAVQRAYRIATERLFSVMPELCR
jgi:RNA polymerase sigma factor (sigma-70 family)